MRKVSIVHSILLFLLLSIFLGIVIFTLNTGIQDSPNPNAPGMLDSIILSPIHVSPLRALQRGSVSGEKYIALTFDDGPNPNTTPFLLDTLKTHGVRATFFVIGIHANKYQDIIKREYDEGHEIASHSWDHRDFLKLTSGEIIKERDRMDTLIYSITGNYPLLYRPPYGLTNTGVQSIYGRPAILWSVDPKDWKYRNVEHNTRAGEQNIKENSIILFHDIYATSVESIGPIISTLQKEGYTFVTVSELLALNGQSLTGSHICYLGNNCK